MTSRLVEQEDARRDAPACGWGRPSPRGGAPRLRRVRWRRAAGRTARSRRSPRGSRGPPRPRRPSSSFIIFIISRMQSVCPASTSSPTSTNARRLRRRRAVEGGHPLGLHHVVAVRAVVHGGRRRRRSRRRRPARPRPARPTPALRTVILRSPSSMTTSSTSLSSTMPRMSLARGRRVCRPAGRPPGCELRYAVVHAEHVALGTDVVPLEVGARRLREQRVARAGPPRSAPARRSPRGSPRASRRRGRPGARRWAPRPRGRAASTSRDTGPGAAPYLPRRYCFISSGTMCQRRPGEHVEHRLRADDLAHRRDQRREADLGAHDRGSPRAPRAGGRGRSAP